MLDEDFDHRVTYIAKTFANCLSCSKQDDGYWIVLSDGTARYATAQEIAAADTAIAANITEEGTARTAVKQALSRLQQIESGVQGATLAQTQTAVKDMATMLRHLIRLTFD